MNLEGLACRNRVMAWWHGLVNLDQSVLEIEGVEEDQREEQGTLCEFLPCPPAAFLWFPHPLFQNLWLSSERGRNKALT